MIGISKTNQLLFITHCGKGIISAGKIILYLSLSGFKEDLEDPVSSDVSIKSALYTSSIQMESISPFKAYGTGTISAIYFALINQSELDSQSITEERLLITLLMQPNILLTFCQTFWKTVLLIWVKTQFIWLGKVMQAITFQPLLKRF